MNSPASCPGTGRPLRPQLRPPDPPSPFDTQAATRPRAPARSASRVTSRHAMSASGHAYDKSHSDSGGCRMANKEHVALLKQGVEVWNKWREANRDVRLYMAGADLTDAHLTGAYLDGAQLTGANLTRAYLIRADLTGADLIARLTDADLTGADLTGADLTGANLTGAD